MTVPAEVPAEAKDGPMISIIVAVAENGVIGRGGDLPWRLPDDLRYFKRITMGHPLVMGRKTFESIGRPLPGRTNIVLTRDPAWRAEGVDTAHTLDQALDLARSAPGGEDVMVIGGADVFARALPLADRLYLTEVLDTVPGDVYFPPFDRAEWREVDRTAGQPDDSGRHTHDFVVLDRI